MTAERLGHPITDMNGNAPPMGNIDRRAMDDDWAANSGDWQARQAAQPNIAPRQMPTTTYDANQDWIRNPPPTNAGHNPNTYVAPNAPVTTPAVPYGASSTTGTAGSLGSLGNSGGSLGNPSGLLSGATGALSGGQLSGSLGSNQGSNASSTNGQIDVYEATPTTGTSTGYAASLQGSAPTIEGSTWQGQDATANSYDAAAYDMNNTDASGRNGVMEDRLTGLLSRDSEYMQLARARALQQMNARGLSNSSMAVGAAHNAAIQSALPIAQQDAQAFNQVGLSNVGAVNQASATNTNAANQFGLANQALDARSASENAAAAQAANTWTAAADLQQNTADQNATNTSRQYNAGAANTFASRNMDAINAMASDFAQASNEASIQNAENNLRVFLQESAQDIDNYRTDAQRQTALDNMAMEMTRFAITAGFGADSDKMANYLALVSDMNPSLGLTITDQAAEDASASVD